MKDQVILKQQYVIKRLLRKCYGADFCPPSPNKNVQHHQGNHHPHLAKLTSDSSSKETNTNGSEDYDAQNDSDSAIMLEDHLTEVSLLVPSVVNKDMEVKVIRSISDVVKAKEGNNNSNGSPQSTSSTAATSTSTATATIKSISAARKTKEERRISNRQKLLTIAKRHSGFLKRPDILETVYSVEEDGDQQQQQHQQQQQPKKEDDAGAAAAKMPKAANIENSKSNTASARRDSSSNSNCVLTGFRYRLDSDITASDLDYSTDDESVRLFSTTDGSSIATTCSQPCSRRSSYGGPCSLPCSRRSSYGHTPLASSRRSSYGSHVNLNNVSTATTTSDENESSELKVQSTFNRVMSNHRTMTKPKDVKFKRINKSKSRSLEELRGKLKWHIAPDIVIQDMEEEDGIDEDEDEEPISRPNTVTRGRLIHYASLDQGCSYSSHQHQSEA